MMTHIVQYTRVLAKREMGAKRRPLPIIALNVPRESPLLNCSKVPCSLVVISKLNHTASDLHW